MNKIATFRRVLASNARTTGALSPLRSLSTEPFYGWPRPVVQTNTSSSRPVTAWELVWENAIIALRDPTRADAVAAVGELTGRFALHRLLSVMRDHPVGQEILRDRPIVSKATIPHEKLLENAAAVAKNKDNATDTSHSNACTITFGQAYGLFLLEHGFDPDERSPIRFIDDPDLAYVMLRYRQCHDFFHALTALPPTVMGEVGLKWLELFQTGLPLAAVSATVGSFGTLPREQARIVWDVYRPWAQRVAQRMQFGQLLNVYYEKEWDTPLDELRQRLGVEPAPNVPGVGES